MPQDVDARHCPACLDAGERRLSVNNASTGVDSELRVSLLRVCAADLCRRREHVGSVPSHVWSAMVCSMAVTMPTIRGETHNSNNSCGTVVVSWYYRIHDTIVRACT